MSLRVYLVDDHPAVLAALTGALGRQSDLRVVGTAMTAAEAYADLAGGTVRADVAVVDVCLPDDDGITLCRRLAEARPGLRCVLLSASDDPANARAALAAGAAAYLVKDLSTDDLVAALRNAARGTRFADPRVTRVLPRGGGVAALSRAERHVLRLVADGLSNAEIGDALDAPPGAVGARVARLLVKLGARSRAEAALIALREGA